MFSNLHQGCLRGYAKGEYSALVTMGRIMTKRKERIVTIKIERIAKIQESVFISHAPSRTLVILISLMVSVSRGIRIPMSGRYATAKKAAIPSGLSVLAIMYRISNLEIHGKGAG